MAKSLRSGKGYRRHCLQGRLVTLSLITYILGMKIVSFNKAN